MGKPESYKFDCKRLGEKLTTVLETVVAFANSDGGVIGLGFEDPDKGAGRNRVYGSQENPMKLVVFAYFRGEWWTALEPTQISSTSRQKQNVLKKSHRCWKKPTTNDLPHWRAE